ncbi:MAG: PhoX family phosphatase, partial [Acidobacteriota bacterium]
LLAVNHEFTDPVMMFLDYTPGSPTERQVKTELAAQGVSIVEVVRSANGEWSYDITSRFNHRTTSDTEMEITGPAAGHPLLMVSDDPTGTKVRGTLNNCAAGKTPWGSLLTCEENFNQYFANLSSLASSDPRKAMHSRYGLTSGASERRWELFIKRFDIAKEPNEPFRFGWVVEIDPYNPNFVPKKRTALGRLKHEAATTTIAKSGQAVVYTGDDERFDYMYKFVSKGKFNRTNRQENFNLLDEGTLYVAKFNDDGSGEWLPLIAGQGPLASMSQAEILINTRAAADLVKATKMDRPEDIEINPINGKLYCVFTNNTRRGASGNPGIDKANPRANNRHGHIIELTEKDNDSAATSFNWEIFILCGDPANADDKAFFAGFDMTRVSAISSPDNIVFDKRGNLWIATDGQPGTFKKNDGIYAVPVAGDERGFLRQFLSAPVAAEICGPEFTPNNETLFCAIQHPGEGGKVAAPISTWPDGTTPARPSVVAIVKTSDGSKVIGK